MSLMALRTTNPARLGAMMVLRSLARGFKHIAAEVESGGLKLHHIRKSLEASGRRHKTGVTDEEVDALIKTYGGEQAFVWGIGNA